MGQKGTGRRLSDQERMEIIARLEGDKPHASAAECARQYGVSSAAITKLMKMKDKIKQRFRENNAFSQQRRRGGTDRHAAFEDELFQWISMQHAEIEQRVGTITPNKETTDDMKEDISTLRRSTSGLVLTAARVQEKAQELLKEHTLGNFRASKGWFYRFCRRYGISRTTLMPLEGTMVEEGDDGLEGSGSETEEQIAGAVDDSLGHEQGFNEESKGDDKTNKKIKHKTDVNGSKKWSKNGSGKSAYWLGIQSLQDTLAKAAMALDHPEGREYLGDDAASEMLRSIQQSMGVVECIRQKKKSTHVVSVPGSTGTPAGSGVSEIGSSGGILEDVVV